MHKRYMLGSLTRMENAGPRRAMTPPKLGTRVMRPAINAQTGASGTCNRRRPVSHSTATHKPSMVTARHQLTSALPAVRRRSELLDENGLAAGSPCLAAGGSDA